MEYDEGNKENINLFYESDKLVNRYKCGICGESKAYTRIFCNYKIMKSLFVCYNCGEDLKKCGYEPLKIPLKVKENQ